MPLLQESSILNSPPKEDWMILKSYSSDPKQVESQLISKKAKSVREALTQRSLLHPFIQDTLCSLRSSHPASAIAINKVALRSFCELIRLLHRGDLTPALRSCIVHFLRQLKSLLPDENANPADVEIVIQAHDIFIRALDLSSLEHDHLLTLTIQLKLLIDSNEALVAKAFNYLIAQNSDALGAKLLDISFVKTNRLSFAQVNDAIDGAHHKYANQNDQIARIILYSNLSVKIDEDETRGFILSIMHMFIVENIARAFKDGRVEIWACRVINNLLVIAKTASDRVLLSVASCLGLFGAIDAARFLELPGSEGVTKTKVYSIETNTVEFKEQLLRDIAEKCLSLSGSAAQVIYQCSLKKLFHALGMKLKDRFFLSLPLNLRTLCQASLASPFMAEPVSMSGDGPKSLPLFHANGSYNNWISSWVHEMISDFRAGTPIDDLFIALRPIFHQDISFLEEMLPCVIFNYINSSHITDQRKNDLIRNEIHKVISSALPQGHQLSTFDISSAVDAQISVTGPVLTRTQLMASQRIFSLFDTFTAWLKISEKRPALDIQRLEKPRSDAIFTYLFGSVDRCSMAYLAYGCKAYTRSLKYLEEYLHHSADGKLSAACSTLFQQIYLALDDPDGAIGAKGHRNAYDLRDKILGHEADNTTQDALACCGKALHTYPDSLEYHKKIIRCLMSLEQLSLAMITAKNTMAERPEWQDKISPYMATCAWQLGDWTALEQVISKNCNIPVEKSNMSLNIGRLINCAVTNDGERFPQLLKSITIRAMRPISVAVSEKLPYELCYPHLVRIQELNEIRMASSVLHNVYLDMEFEDLNPMWLRKFWQSRNRYLQPNLKVLGVMLTLQRTLFSIKIPGSPSQIKAEDYTMDIANCWLETAKLARKLGHNQRAYVCFLHLDEMMHRLTKDLQFVTSYVIEKAKYVWSGGNENSHESAIRVLEEGEYEFFRDLAKISQENPATRANDSKKSEISPGRAAYYKIIFLKAKLYEESGLENITNIIQMYDKLGEDLKRCEKGAVQMAKLYDKMCMYESKLAIDTTLVCDYMYQAILFYSSALSVGNKYIYEALPRLLQMWFDLGSVLSHYEQQVKGKPGKPRSRDVHHRAKDVSSTFDKATKEIEKLKNSVNVSTLYTALSQMLTRLDHSNHKVQNVLASLVVKILQAFPKQSSWFLFANLFNKNHTLLKKACENIILKATANDPKLRHFFDSMENMAGHCRELINVQPNTKAKTMRIESLTQVGLQQFIKKHPNQILMPCHKFLTPSIMPALPPAFGPAVTISAVKSEIIVFDSMAKPKKFILLGSDGKTYPFLAKPDDDLRRDSRTVEYLELFNRLMQKDSETRKRNLKITVFAVIPFGEESGLIEFIEGLTDIRSILTNEYKNTKNERDTQKHSSWMKHIRDRHQAATRDNISDETATAKYREYMKSFCKPPVFWNWFLQNYSHPSEWHAAKLLFTRSLAVMSIVGYILGLGDRHLENILIEKATGRIVHVDFNCIFNKGETLQIPERVPFRLTHNLTDAMGNICFEGHFKRTCEEVLRVARNNAAPIMSVLKAFAYDPLVGAAVKSMKTQQQAGRDSKGAAGDTSRMIEDIPCSDKVSIVDIVEKIETSNQEAIDSIKRIDERLRGFHRASLSPSNDVHTQPLSVKGQVNALIAEATDETRLARMFIGWAPYL